MKEKTFSFFHITSPLNTIVSDFCLRLQMKYITLVYGKNDKKLSY